MKKLLLALLLLISAPVARAQPTEAQEAWQTILDSNNVANAKTWVAKPDFDPLLKLPNSDSSLLSAALQKRRAAIATLLVQNARDDAYLRDKDALYYLPVKESTSVLKLYLANPKFDSNALIEGEPLLVRMVSVGNLEGAKLLLANARIKPMARDNDGYTALHALVYQPSGPMAALLLADKRIDPNAVDKNGNTALHVNAFHGDANVLKRLSADARVNPNLKNKRGETPLFLAASSDMALVRILLANKKVKVGPKEKTQIAKLKKAGGVISAGGEAG